MTTTNTPAPIASAPIGADAERSAYEAWYRKQYESTLYCESRWEAWQARAALASASQPCHGPGSYAARLAGITHRLRGSCDRHNATADRAVAIGAAADEEVAALKTALASAAQPTPDLSDYCANCGQAYGAHNGVQCPLGVPSWWRPLAAAPKAAPALPGAAYVELPDERATFESQFPVPGGVSWNGSEYVVKDEYLDSYRCDRFVGQWAAWQARASRGQAPAPAAVAGPSEPVGRVDGDGAVTWLAPIPERGANLYAAPTTQAAPSAEPLVRYCPGCGSVGPLEGNYKDCCPDGSEARMIPQALAEKCRDTFKLALDGLLAQQLPAPAAQGDAREETSIGKAVNRAARDLPEGWEIRIDLERHAGVVFLIDPDGSETMSEGGELFGDQINAAIDVAIRARGAQGESK